MKMSLNNKAKHIDVVISLGGVSDITRLIDKLNTWCSIFMEQYGFILHDKDVNMVDGQPQPKLPHIHLCGALKSCQTRLGTTLNNIAEILDINPLAISIEKLISLNYGYQYLIHKNDSNKYQYDKSDIYTNLNENELEDYINTEDSSLSIERLIQTVIDNHGRKVSIMRALGLSYYHLYRNEIKDIIDSWETGEIGLPWEERNATQLEIK